MRIISFTRPTCISLFENNKWSTLAADANASAAFVMHRVKFDKVAQRTSNSSERSGHAVPIIKEFRSQSPNQQN